jgi:hypothetical protein
VGVVDLQVRHEPLLLLLPDGVAFFYRPCKERGGEAARPPFHLAADPEFIPPACRFVWIPPAPLPPARPHPTPTPHPRLHSGPQTELKKNTKQPVFEGGRRRCPGCAPLLLERVRPFAPDRPGHGHADKLRRYSGFFVHSPKRRTQSSLSRTEKLVQLPKPDDLGVLLVVLAGAGGDLIAREAAARAAAASAAAAAARLAARAVAAVQQRQRQAARRSAAAQVVEDRGLAPIPPLQIRKK